MSKHGHRVPPEEKTLEIKREQGYFDDAADLRERIRQRAIRAPEAAAHTGAARALRVGGLARAANLQPPDKSVAFGRIDLEDGDRLYIGRDGLLGAREEAVVVSWQAPAAQPYYRANVDDPHGVAIKRSYSTRENTILDFEDLILEELARAVEGLDAAAPLPSDALLDELARSRTGELREIAQTISAAQYDVISESPDQVLVVQGGPGTGKTVLALHRVSWLLFNHRDRFEASDIVVVGPNATFVNYINRVLPQLGDENVGHRSLTGFFSGVRSGRVESPEVTRIKGEPRMESLIDRGLQNRVVIPEAPIETILGSQLVQVDPGLIANAIKGATDLPYARGRQSVRDQLRPLLEGMVPAAVLAEEVDRVVDRVWPQLTPQAFLRDLFGSEGRLVRAGGDEFLAEEVLTLHRKATDRLADEMWSEADVPLLAYAALAITGEVSLTYGHVVIDEAQDLSPMSLRMLRRVSENGSMTVLGDLAQSTGGWARDSWDEVLRELDPENTRSKVVELKYGYRVPQEIFEYAAQLLPYAAPGIQPPTVVRPGGAPPEIVEAVFEDLGDEAVAVAQRFSGRGLRVGVISPPDAWDVLREAFHRKGVEWSEARTAGLTRPITIIAPTDAKGLEFDAAIVVEPSLIAESDARGLRLLYVALTRTTSQLAVIHSGIELPLPDAQPRTPRAHESPPIAGENGSDPAQPEAQNSAEASGTQASRVEAALASALAGELRQTVNPERWRTILDLVARSLDLDRMGSED